jgi:hypothetical protein
LGMHNLRAAERALTGGGSGPMTSLVKADSLSQLPFGRTALKRERSRGRGGRFARNAVAQWIAESFSTLGVVVEFKDPVWRAYTKLWVAKRKLSVSSASSFFWCYGFEDSDRVQEFNQCKSRYLRVMRIRKRTERNLLRAGDQRKKDTMITPVVESPGTLSEVPEVVVLTKEPETRIISSGADSVRVPPSPTPRREASTQVDHLVNPRAMTTYHLYDDSDWFLYGNGL